MRLRPVATCQTDTGEFSHALQVLKWSHYLISDVIVGSFGEEDRKTWVGGRGPRHTRKRREQTQCAHNCDGTHFSAVVTMQENYCNKCAPWRVGGAHTHAPLVVEPTNSSSIKLKKAGNHTHYRFYVYVYVCLYVCISVRTYILTYPKHVRPLNTPSAVISCAFFCLGSMSGAREVRILTHTVIYISSYCRGLATCKQLRAVKARSVQHAALYDTAHTTCTCDGARFSNWRSGRSLRRHLSSGTRGNCSLSRPRQ